MSGPAAPVSGHGPDPEAAWPPRISIGRSAALIAALTVASRLLGLGRRLVAAYGLDGGDVRAALERFRSRRPA